MSRVPAPSDDARLRSARRLALVGAVLCLPQVIEGWFLIPAGLDLVTLVLPFVYVAGVLVLAVAATRAWKVRSDRNLPVVAAGVACVVVATVLFSVWPPDQAQLAYSGQVFAPLSRVVHLTYLFVLVGALWQFGFFLFVGALGSAVTRLRTDRAAR